MNELCVCGHVLDEHDPRNGECDIEDCQCFYFEADDDYEDGVS